jgi:hypothetical protein
VRNRGVVVEIAKRNHIIVMTSRGEFVQVPFKKQVYVGQEVSFKQKERITPWQVGAAAMLFLALVSSWNMFIGNLVPGMNTPAFLITLDFNPSIELSVSEAHKVLAASGLNDDGEALISRINVVGEPLTLALERISTQAEQDGYLRQGAGEIIVTIAARDSQDTTFVELKNSRTGDHSKLEQAIVGALTQNSLAQVRIWQVPTQVLVDAKTAGITPARYIAIRQQAQAIVPQRIEARLTTAERQERAQEPEGGEAIAAAAAFGSAPRPVLTPLQWTNTASAHTVSDRPSQLPFSFSNRMKGALSYSE